MSELRGWEIHLAHLQELTSVTGPINTEAPTASHLQPAHFTPDLRPRPDRRRLHRAIIDEFFAESPDVARTGQSLVLSGPPGAGKSSALRDRIPAGDEAHWRFIDPDDFKSRLIRHLVERGEFEELTPKPVRLFQNSGERFAAGEFAALVHEESSMLARMAFIEATRQRDNIVIDGVNGSASRLSSRIEGLAHSGYTNVGLICVDGSQATTRARVQDRWKRGYEAFLANQDPHGVDARYVPEDVTATLYTSQNDLSSCSEAVSQALTTANPELLVEAKFYRVDAPSSSPLLYRELRKSAGKITSNTLSVPSPAHTAAHQAIGTDGERGDVQVSAYTRADGTQISAHTRHRSS